MRIYARLSYRRRLLGHWLRLKACVRVCVRVCASAHETETHMVRERRIPLMNTVNACASACTCVRVCVYACISVQVHACVRDVCVCVVPVPVLTNLTEASRCCSPVTAASVLYCTHPMLAAFALYVCGVCVCM